MIPDAAVEAAAKRLHDIDCRSAMHSGHPADFECYGWMDEARELLEAIAPHMLAEAWDDGCAEGFARGDDTQRLEGHQHQPVQEPGMSAHDRKAVLLQVEGEGPPIYFSDASVEIRNLDENTIEVTVSRTP